MFEIMRKLHPRSATNPGVCVDADGATLGPDWLLVERTASGYRVAPRIAAGDVQKVLLINQWEPDWLYEQGWRIAKALDRGETALAQIYGLRIPLDDIDQRQLKRLAALAELRKAGFNPDEPRIPASQPHGGEWTTGDDSGGEGDSGNSEEEWTTGGDGGGGNWATDDDGGGGGDNGNGDGEWATGDDGGSKSSPDDDGGGEGTGSSNSGTNAVFSPALRYAGETEASLAAPLVGGRWPAPAGASANPLFFPAQAEEDDNGRGVLLGDFMNLPVEFRQAMYEALRARIEELEPGNPALQTLTGLNYSPTQEDIDALSEALREAQVRAGEPPATEWELGWGARGVALEQQRLGGQRTLPFNAPTIDAFQNGVGISIKSIDLDAPWYGNPLNLSYQINRYVNQLWAFDGMSIGDIEIENEEIKGKVLDIVVPINSGTAAQRQAIASSVERARRMGIQVFISPY